MPTYEFKCCGITEYVTMSIKEIVQSPICKVCNGYMPRVYNSFGISFKGKGFYATDK